jgi:hypothetical protein
VTESEWLECTDPKRMLGFLRGKVSPSYRAEQAKKRKQARPADEGESASEPGTAKP